MSDIKRPGVGLVVLLLKRWKGFAGKTKRFSYGEGIGHIPEDI